MLLFTAIAPSAHAAPLEKGFWGPAAVDGKSQFPIYKRLGVTLYQTSLSWANVAPTRPANPRDPGDAAYQWPAELDDVIAEARRHDMRVLILLAGSPPWANGGKSAEWAPNRPGDFADFVRAASRRYPGVRHWMIWGEPSRSNNFKPLVEQPLGTKITSAQRRAPRRYARLLDAAYGQLKAQRRSNLVIGGNTYVTGEVRPIDWVKSMRLPNGKRPRMDLYGHNPFSFRNPDLRNPPSTQGLVDFSDLGRFDKLIHRYLGRPRGKRIRLFLSEFTIPTGPDREFNFWVSEKTQAKWIKNAFRVARKVDAGGLGWIHLYDEAPIAGHTVVRGGLLTHDGKKKPGFYAFMRGGLTPAQRARERKQLARAAAKR
ncbi:MAG TPA: hypothetical protein VGR11_13655 [Solirubrobacteraceae bacterium]|nr:hypothetical protein [Solirubrobacteraceae bacterium]